MSKRLSKKMTAEKFNASYPVGTPCKYFPLSDDPHFVETRTRSDAWVLGHGAVVVAVEDRSGGVLITHLEMKP